jgi:hypothetical protein
MAEVIDLGADIVFEVKYGGQVYSVKEPNVKQIQKLQDSDGSQHAVIDLLNDLGMPRAVSETMPVSKVMALVNGLSRVLSEKK